MMKKREKIRLTDKDLIIETASPAVSLLRVYKFSSGFGASVVRFKRKNKREKLKWGVMLIKFCKEGEDYFLKHDEEKRCNSEEEVNKYITCLKRKYRKEIK